MARLHEIYRAELTAAKAGGGPVSRGLCVFNETDLSKVDFDRLLANADRAFEEARLTAPTWLRR